MSSYNQSPVFSIKGSGIRNNSGTIANGNDNSARWNSTLLNAMNTGVTNRFTGVYADWETGVSALLQSAGVALTNNVVQSSTTGFCKLPINSHGFALGQMVIVIGTDVAKYNQIHRVTAIIDTNNVQTDVPYSVDATVAGTFKTVLGTFASMTKNQYVGTVIGAQVAGIANTILRSPSAEYFRVPYGSAKGNQRYGITSWDYVTGKATFNGNRGANMYYHDIAGNNDNLQSEPFPTKAVPGHLVYFYSAQDLATVSYYKPRQA